jgi:hypothetical protein
VSFRVSDFDEGTNSSTSLLFDGGEYKVEPKFEKMMYERLTSRTNNQQTNIQLGLYVNDNKENIPEPVVGDALLFYTYKQNTSSAKEYIEWDTHYSISFTEITSLEYILLMQGELMSLVIYRL